MSQKRGLIARVLAAAALLGACGGDEDSAATGPIGSRSAPGTLRRSSASADRIQRTLRRDAPDASGKPARHDHRDVHRAMHRSIGRPDLQVVG